MSVLVKKEVLREKAKNIEDSEFECNLETLLQTQKTSRMFLNIASGAYCTECDNRSNLYEQIALPQGNQQSPIMFVGKMPSYLESAVHVSHLDAGWITLQSLLRQAGIDPASVYCTNIVKCHTQAMTDDICKICAIKILQHEIYTIKPKIIFCEGISVLRFLGKYGIIKASESDISYFKEIPIPTGIISCIYDIDQLNKLDAKEYQNRSALVVEHLKKLCILNKEGELQ